MAIGFPASFTTSINTAGSLDDVRARIIQAFTSLGWEYQTLGPDRCAAQIPVNILSWGETLTVDLSQANTIKVTSKCRGIQVFDWGKNKQNVDQFITHFEPWHDRGARLAQGEQKYIDKDGRSPIENLIRDDKGGS